MKILKALLIIGGILIVACIVMALIAAPNMPKTTQQQAATTQPAQDKPVAQLVPTQAQIQAQPTNTTQPAQPTQTAEPTQAPAPTVAPPFPVTLTGKVIKCEPSIIYKAKQDTALIGIEVSLKNTGTDVVNINPLSFELIDADGYVYRAVLASCNGQLDTTKLSPSTAIRGELGFELPKGAVPKSVKFSIDPFGQDTVTVDLVQ